MKDEKRIFNRTCHVLYSKSCKKEIQKTRTEYELSLEDEVVLNHSYKVEQELLECVRNGEVEKVRENCKKTFPQYPKLLGYMEKKNEEYMAVITVALVTRTAIEAGVTTAESFQLSDVYLKKFASTTDIESLIKIRNQACVAFAELVKQRKKRTKVNLYIEECKKYIIANVFKKISASDVADALNVNSIYLERIFRAEENMTITDFIQHEKIARAKNLLIYSDRSILEIGEYLNFSSQSYFGKIFRKITGMTPKQFREANHLSEF